MRRAAGLAAIYAGLSCAPTTLEPEPVGGGDVHAFLLVERSGGLEIRPLSGAPSVEVWNGAESALHLLTIPREKTATAHPLVDATRSEALEVRSQSRGELEACAERGLLDLTTRGGPVLAFHVAELDGKLHALESGAWAEIEMPGSGALADLAALVPIQDSCRTRQWNAESFFARSPVFEFGDQIREFTFTREWPSAVSVYGVHALPDSALLVFSVAVLVTARPGGPLEKSGALLASDLPAPPSAWRPAGAAELTWQFEKVVPMRTSTSGAGYFLVNANARSRGDEQVGMEAGGTIAELRYDNGRIRFERTLYQAAARSSGEILDVAPLGDEGGFVVVATDELIVQATRDSPLQRWPAIWSPTSVLPTNIPGAEVVIGTSQAGFWVGDPTAGFDGLRFERTAPGTPGCHRLEIGQVQGERSVIARCGQRRIWVRKNGGWESVRPWFPKIPFCNLDQIDCGRSTSNDNVGFQNFGPGPEQQWMVCPDRCPFSFSFSFGDNTCAQTEVFDLLPFREEIDDTDPNEMFGIEFFEEGRVAFGDGGLVVRVTESGAE